MSYRFTCRTAPFLSAVLPSFLSSAPAAAAAAAAARALAPGVVILLPNVTVSSRWLALAEEEDFSDAAGLGVAAEGVLVPALDVLADGVLALDVRGPEGALLAADSLAPNITVSSASERQGVTREAL